MAQGRKTGGRVKGTANRATAEIREHAQQYTVEALEGLAQIARTSESDAAKVSAWKAILDRGHGRPAQAVQVGTDPDSVPVVYVMRFSDGLKPARDGAEIDHAGVDLSPHAGPALIDIEQ